MTLDPQAFETLIASGQPAIAVVRCENAQVHSPGSRHEQVRIDATILKKGVGEPPTKWQLRCFTQGDPKMRKGGTYLVAGLAEFPDDWELVDVAAVSTNDAPAALERAVESFKAAQAKKK